MFSIIKNKAITIFAIAIILSAAVSGQTGKAATDYLTLPGPIQFDSKRYNLSWSSHPAANFYKQEYLVKGDIESQYKTMVLIDVVTGQADLKSVVAAKTTALKKMKENNPVINYEIVQNPTTGEYMLDFLVTANGADGNISIIERNVYRYKTFIDKAGHKSVLLFGISTRAYGTAVNQFLTVLKATRKDLMTKVSQFKMPEIIITK